MQYHWLAWWGIFLLAASPLHSQKVLGTPNWEEARAILALPDGTSVITGKWRPGPSESFDILLLHLSPKGEVLRRQTFGGAQQDEGMWLEPTRDGGFLLAAYAYELAIGYGRHDIWLLKFNAQAELEWGQLHGRPFREIPFCVRETDAGYILGGYTKSQGLHGDYLLMALDANGKLLWDQYYEAPYVDIGHTVVPCPGGYLIAGSTAGYYFPSQANHHYPQSNIMIIRTDEEGKELERRFYGGARHEFARNLLPGPDGDWYLFGSAQKERKGDFDYWLMHLDADLDSIEAWSYGGLDFEQGEQMVAHPEGFYLYGSRTGKPWTGNREAWAISVDFKGQKTGQWSTEWRESTYGTGISRAKKGFIATGYHLQGEDADLIWFPSDPNPGYGGPPPVNPGHGNPTSESVSPVGAQK